MQPARARLTEHALTLDRRARGFDADDANVIKAAPAGDIRKHHPHDADRRLHNPGGASYVVCRRNGAESIGWVAWVEVNHSQEGAAPAPQQTCRTQESVLTIGSARSFVVGN